MKIWFGHVICQNVFGRKFLEMYVVRCQNMPYKEDVTLFGCFIRQHFYNCQLERHAK